MGGLWLSVLLEYLSTRNCPQEGIHVKASGRTSSGGPKVGLDPWGVYKFLCWSSCQQEIGVAVNNKFLCWSSCQQETIRKKVFT
jgi:hypothetical protein